jgi:hypothetical protein
VCGGVPPRDRAVSDWDAESGFAGGREAARERAGEDLPYAGEHGYELPQAVARALPGLVPHDRRLRADAVERKLAAVRRHASQLAPLSAGAPSLLRPDGVLARERFWAKPWQIPREASSCGE